MNGVHGQVTIFFSDTNILTPLTLLAPEILIQSLGAKNPVDSYREISLQKDSILMAVNMASLLRELPLPHPSMSSYLT